MEYYQLNQSNLVDYLATLPEMRNRFSSFENLAVKEISDGNMNYSYVVTNQSHPQESVFFKQAPPYIKVLGKDWPLTRQRMAAEIRTLSYQSSVCPEMVPEIYYQSEEMSVLITQNLSSHQIIRSELIAGKYFPRLAEDLSTFLAETLFYSSDFAMSSEDKKDLVSRSANKEMCKITEDFVFTYPFEHHDMNDYNVELSQEIIDSIQKNSMLRAHVAQMKHLYMTKTESLLHGDLHTSSIMANVEGTYVIDSEFAFVGPMGFDIGAIIANLYLCYFTHACKPDQQSIEYSQWVLSTIEDIWKKFESKFLTLWTDHEHASELAFMGRDLTGDSHQSFRLLFLQQVLADAIGFAAVKMIRRILGVAKVADLMQIEDLVLRAKLETQALTMAGKMLVDRNTFSNISELNLLARETSAHYG